MNIKYAIAALCAALRSRPDTRPAAPKPPDDWKPVAENMARERNEFRAERDELADRLAALEDACASSPEKVRHDHDARIAARAALAKLDGGK